MNISHTPDGQKPDKIQWTPERKSEFVDLWNRVHPHKVADHFGIKRSYAFVLATQLRSEGRDVMYRSHNHAGAQLCDGDRAQLMEMLDGLCRIYRVAPALVMGDKRVHDGRVAVRKALTWAGHELLGLSWRQVGLFFGARNHTSMIYRAQSATARDKQAAMDVYDCITA